MVGFIDMTRLLASGREKAYYSRGQRSDVNRPLEFASEPRVCVFTGVVKLRKLTSDLITIAPYLGAERLLQTKGLLETRPVLGRFSRTESHQILPFSGKNVHEHGR